MRMLKAMQHSTAARVSTLRTPGETALTSASTPRWAVIFTQWDAPKSTNQAKRKTVASKAQRMLSLKT